MDMEKLGQFYDLNKPVKSFAIDNDFVNLMNKACYKLGTLKQAFCFNADEKEKEWGCVDLATFGAVCNPTMSILQEMAAYRAKLYGGINAENPTIEKAVMLDYLLTVSVCYVEIPRYTRLADGTPKRTYDKYLATKNASLMAVWMGGTPNEMQLKYGNKIITGVGEIYDGKIKLVKLNNNANKGNSITVPRKEIRIENIKCMPLFMGYAFLKGLESSLRNSLVKLTFLKDNGLERELVTTLSPKIIYDIYEDNHVVERMMMSANIFRSNFDDSEGVVSISTSQDRGYIKFPEIGSSIYDATNVRAVSYARILKVEEVTADQLDLRFLKVEMTSVIEKFSNFIIEMSAKNPNGVRPLIAEFDDAFFERTGNQDTSIYKVAVDFAQYMKSAEIILGTELIKYTHTFMINHPDIFPTYTGEGGIAVQSSNDFGVDVMGEW